MYVCMYVCVCILLTASLLGLLYRFEDGGNKFLRNVVKLLPGYAVSHPESHILHSH